LVAVLEGGLRWVEGEKNKSVHVPAALRQVCGDYSGGKIFNPE
jgi:hypothetical protein